jgi:DNA repair protein RadC
MSTETTTVKHTPGPWECSAIYPREIRSTIVNSSAKRVSIAINHSGISDEEAEANAKLIAAAP